MARGMNPIQFARAITRLSENVKANALIAVKKSAITIDQKLVTSTPADTGRAQVNWLAKIAAPDLDVKDAPSSPSAGANEAMSQARSEIGQYKLGRGGIFISNNLPYIKRLNDGYSDQEPAGMVERALQAGKKFIKSVELLKKPKGI